MTVRDSRVLATVLFMFQVFTGPRLSINSGFDFLLTTTTDFQVENARPTCTCLRDHAACTANRTETILFYLLLPYDNDDCTTVNLFIRVHNNTD